MEKLLSFLENNYDVTVKDDLVNCTELAKIFNLQDVDLLQYKSAKKIKTNIYLCGGDCVTMIKTNNIRELFFLTEKIYCCENCGKIFSRKYNLEQHTINEKCKKNDTTCTTCNKKYDSRAKLKRHFTSKKHIELIKTSTTLNKSNLVNVHGNKNSLTTNNTINYNLNIVIPKDFYDPNLLNDLTEQEKMTILTKGVDYVQNLVKMMHFKANNPETHNVISENVREKRGAIFTDGEWKSKNITKIATELMENRTKDIRIIFDKYKLLLSKTDFEKVESCLKKIVPVAPEEFTEHTKKTTGLPAIQALEMSNELLARINRIEQNKKELIEEIQLIIYDNTKKLKLKR